jgi:hypothetical protein
LYKKTSNLLKLFVKDIHSIKKSKIGKKLQNLNTVPEPETQFVISAPAPEGDFIDRQPFHSALGLGVSVNF